MPGTFNTKLGGANLPDTQLGTIDTGTVNYNNIPIVTPDSKPNSLLQLISGAGEATVKILTGRQEEINKQDREQKALVAKVNVTDVVTKQLNDDAYKSMTSVDKMKFLQDKMTKLPSSLRGMASADGSVSEKEFTTVLETYTDLYDKAYQQEAALVKKNELENRVQQANSSIINSLDMTDANLVTAYKIQVPEASHADAVNFVQKARINGIVTKMYATKNTDAAHTDIYKLYTNEEYASHQQELYSAMTVINNFADHQSNLAIKQAKLESDKELTRLVQLMSKGELTPQVLNESIQSNKLDSTDIRTAYALKDNMDDSKYSPTGDAVLAAKLQVKAAGGSLTVDQLALQMSKLNKTQFNAIANQIVSYKATDEAGKHYASTNETFINKVRDNNFKAIGKTDMFGKFESAEHEQRANAYVQEVDAWILSYMRKHGKYPDFEEATKYINSIASKYKTP